MKTLLNILLIILLVGSAKGNTRVGGLLEGENFWTSINSPYIIESDLVLEENSTLTIEAGTQIYVYSNASFIVYGQLVTRGNSLNKVVFQSDPGLQFEGAWQGIEIMNVSSAGINLNYTQIYFAEVALNISSDASGNKVKSCEFIKNNYGISGNGFVEIDSSSFSGNYIGVNITNKEISKTTFTENEYGIYNGKEGINLVESCIITNNRAGIYNASNNIIIRYSAVTSNGIGIETNSVGNNSSMIYGNQICFNTTYNVKVIGNKDLDFKNNCWCSLNTQEIAKNQYDFNDNTSLGKVLIQAIDSCYNIPIPQADQFNTLSGIVVTGDSLLKEGIVLLYTDIYSPPVQKTPVVNGRYKFFLRELSTVYIYVIPNPAVVKNYIPTFYGDTPQWYNAAPKYPGSPQSDDVNINLISILPEISPGTYYNGSIIYNSGKSDLGTIYADSWFTSSQDPGTNSNAPRNATVLVYRPDGQIVNWFLTDFTNDYHFFALGEGYYIDVQRPGLHLQGNTMPSSFKSFYTLGSQIVASTTPDFATTIPEKFIRPFNKQTIKIEITDALGTLLKVYEDGRAFDEAIFNGLAAGSYIAILHYDDSVDLKKFIKLE